MSTNHLDPASFTWGLVLGVTFGSWLRGTLDALLPSPRRGSNPPPPGRKPAPPPGPPIVPKPQFPPSRVIPVDWP